MTGCGILITQPFTALVEEFVEVIAFDWATQKAVEQWGPVQFASPRFDFSETGFYTKTMGEGLQKQLLAFTQLIQQDIVVDSKLQSNVWEDEFKALQEWEEPRPINLDPGYLTEAKLVLATTKDRDHRILSLIHI